MCRLFSLELKHGYLDPSNFGVGAARWHDVDAGFPQPPCRTGFSSTRTTFSLILSHRSASPAITFGATRPDPLSNRLSNRLLSLHNGPIHWQADLGVRSPRYRQALVPHKRHPAASK